MCKSVHEIAYCISRLCKDLSDKKREIENDWFYGMIV
jgi:hypothetical protein